MTDPETRAEGIRHVVLVHGLWYGGAVMGFLARRLEQSGFCVRLFNYHTTRVPLDRSARRLQILCQREYAGGAHLLGHSLGGLLTLRMLSEGRWRAPGRVLFLGTPLAGSALARRASHWPGASLLLGQSREALPQGEGHWPKDRDLGMIAGTQRIGLGLIAGGLRGPNDGTVLVSETQHEGLSDHLALPVSHTGLLYSRRVALEAAGFLEDGRFRR